MSTSPAAASSEHEVDDLCGRNPWLGVEVRHLAALAAVAHEGSFRGAADALGYVQSAVSQQVKYLEDIVGHRLFERQRGAPPALTPAGEVLLRHAEEIMSRLGAAHVDLRSIDEIESRALRLGTLESTSIRVVPRILTTLSRRFPNVRPLITEADHENDLLPLVRDGQLDLAFARGADCDASLASVQLLSEPMVLVVAADSELGQRTMPLDAEALRSVALIEHRKIVDLEPRLREAGVEPHYVLASERNAAIHAMVAARVAAAILPALAVDADDPRLRVHTLEGIIDPAVLRLVWLRGRRLPDVCAEFVQLARRIAATIDTTPRPVLAAVA